MTNPTATASAQHRPYVLFALGFRPFYLLAAGLAAAWIPLWVIVWHGHFVIPSGFSTVGWHTHEMLFGFTSAVLVGFLLTAIPNWTGRPTATGLKLAGLAALWVAGRVVMLAGAGLPWQVVAAVDIAFLPLAAASMLPPLVATRNRRNIAFPFVLIFLALANLTLHLDAAGIAPLGAEATRAVLAALLVILVIMGGRVIPFFTKNRLPAAGVGRSERLDILATAATALAAVLSVAAPLTTASGLAALAAAVLLVVRALPWKPWATRSVPMLWVLHAGHAWIAVALFLRAALDLGVAPLHRVEVKLGRVDARRHGTGGTAAHADAHAGPPELDEQGARAEGQLPGLAVADLPDAAGRGVDQHHVAGLHGMGLLQEILGGQALEQQGRRLFVGDFSRNLHRFRSRNVPDVGIGAQAGVHVGDAVAHFEVRDLRPDRLDHAGRLVTESGRQRKGVDALALVDVDIVETDRGLPDLSLAGTRRRQLGRFEAHRVGRSELRDADHAGGGHGVLRGSVGYPPLRRRGARASGRRCGRGARRGGAG